MDWFKIRMQAEGDETVADVDILGIIGSWSDDLWGFSAEDGVMTAKAFIDAVKAIPETVKTIRVHINSPGGDVFAASTIANTLRAEVAKGRKVEVRIVGLAASAASVIAMGGDSIVMADNALFMIHDPWTGQVGNASEMRKAADDLDKIRDAIVATYLWHAELSEEEIVDLMAAETWLDATEAKKLGFVTEITEGLQAAASIQPNTMAHLRVPEQYAERVAALIARPETTPEPDPEPAPAAPEPVASIEPAPVVEPEPDPAPEPEKVDAQKVLNLCAEAQLDVEFARALIERGEAAEVEQLVSAERKRRDEDTQRKDGIVALGMRAGVEQIGHSLASAGVSLDVAKSIILEVAAAKDSAEIETGMTPDEGRRPKSVINHIEVYDRLNKPTVN